MTYTTPTQIGEIDFHDIKVNVYYSYIENTNLFDVAFGLRNSDVGYRWFVYINHDTLEVTYPEGASMPIQTKRDIEIMPKFVVVGVDNLDSEFIGLINERLESEYLRRNKK